MCLTGDLFLIYIISGFFPYLKHIGLSGNHFSYLAMFFLLFFLILKNGKEKNYFLIFFNWPFKTLNSQTSFVVGQQRGSPIP